MYFRFELLLLFMFSYFVDTHFACYPINQLRSLQLYMIVFIGMSVWSRIMRSTLSKKRNWLDRALSIVRKFSLAVLVLPGAKRDGLQRSTSSPWRHRNYVTNRSRCWRNPKNLRSYPDLFSCRAPSFDEDKWAGSLSSLCVPATLSLFLLRVSTDTSKPPPHKKSYLRFLCRRWYINNTNATKAERLEAAMRLRCRCRLAHVFGNATQRNESSTAFVRCGATRGFVTSRASSTFSVCSKTWQEWIGRCQAVFARANRCWCQMRPRKIFQWPKYCLLLLWKQMLFILSERWFG